MRLVLLALSRPLTLIVALIAILVGFFMAIGRMHIDIFPQVGNPVIYVAQPYGGMNPAQMEGFLTYYYEYHFLYITGIESVDSKSVQGAALMKLTFREGTNMEQAMAETVGYVNRARAFMPPGTVPPFITRFDPGSVAVGLLLFTSADPYAGGAAELCSESSATAVCDLAWSFGTSSFWWRPENYCGHAGPAKAEAVRHITGAGHIGGEHGHSRCSIG